MLKKSLSLVIALLISITFAAYEDVLIDFDKLSTYKDSDDEQKKMLYNDNWKAVLNSSADFIINRKYTYCKNAPVSKTPSKELFQGGKADGAVLGVRINFPTSDYNAFATVTPLFEIESYAGEDGNKFVGDGLLKNVGTIKKLILYVKGKNYPHAVYINLKDQDDLTTAYFLGYLNFEGWQARTWENPQYLEDVRKRELVQVPLYPRVEPLVKLNSFTFFRDGEAVSKDFVAYIGWIKVEYDKAIMEREDDIDDEAIWQIRTEASELKGKMERERLARIKELQNLELKKMNVAEGDDEKTVAPKAEPTTP